MRVTASIKILFVFLLVLPAAAYAQQELPIPVENALKYRRVPRSDLERLRRESRLRSGATVVE